MARNVSVVENNARFTEYPYDIRRDAWHDRMRHRLQAMAARVRPGEAVLDVGCNSGYIVELLPKTCVAHGVDLSPELVKKAKTHLASAQVAPAERLPFANKSVDVVILGAVLEYVYDVQCVLREAARVARRAVVGCADHENGTWGAHRVEHHMFMVRGYTAKTLRIDLETIGRVEPFELVPPETPDWYIFEVAL